MSEHARVIFVIAGLDPAIHAAATRFIARQGVDGRVKPGHDGERAGGRAKWRAAP
jgi:hypothetical protein